MFWNIKNFVGFIFAFARHTKIFESFHSSKIPCHTVLCSDHHDDILSTFGIVSGLWHLSTSTWRTSIALLTFAFRPVIHIVQFQSASTRDPSLTTIILPTALLSCFNSYIDNMTSAISNNVNCWWLNNVNYMYDYEQYSTPPNRAQCLTQKAVKQLKQCLHDGTLFEVHSNCHGILNTSPPAEDCLKHCLNLFSVELTLNVLDYVVRTGYLMVTVGSVFWLKVV